MILVAITAATLAYVLRESILTWLKAAGLLVTNYRGRSLPAGYGLGYALSLIPSWAIASLLWPDLITVSLAVVLATLIGFVDDAAGVNESKGIKGHLRLAITEKRITTGLLKILYISIAAYLLVQSSWPVLILEVAILALLANFMNGLDLRPGRANKVFLVVAIPLGFLLYPGFASLVLFSTVAVVLVYLPLDLKEKAIMGDAGAYVLGLLLGYAIINMFSTLELFLILFFLVYLHWFMEVGSISEVIENNGVLKRIDDWGRVREENHNENRP